MINRTKTLKLIKEKVDARTNGKINLKKPFWAVFVEGMFRHTERRRITKLVKNGNSVMWIDEAFRVRNITMLDTKDLHKIMWQLISESEKKQIALEHLIETKSYLTD